MLRRDARTPNNAVAAEVGVAPSTCHARIRLLESRGVIRGYHAEVALGAIGTPLQAMIAVRLRAGARDKLARFTADLTAHSQVLSVYFLAGHDDFLIHVAVPDTETLREFVLEELSANPEVAATQTNLIFEHVLGGASK